MIYLRRDSDIAVLETADQLPAYQAAGWEVISADEYRALRQARERAIVAGLIAAAQARNARPAAPVNQNACRYCHGGPIVRPFGYAPWCRRCGRPQVGDARQR